MKIIRLKFRPSKFRVKIQFRLRLRPTPARQSRRFKRSIRRRRHFKPRRPQPTLSSTAKLVMKEF